MTTAVVVTTIITDQAGETSFMTQLLEQIRKQETDLRAKLMHTDREVTITSTIFPVAEFARHFQEWVQRREVVVKPMTNGVKPQAAPTQELNEAELMDYVFAQMQQQGAPAHTALTAELLAEIEDEPIGEHYSQNPFLY